MIKPTFWFSTWSDTNNAVKLQKIARSLKFRFYEVEGLYYLCSGNKGADQLLGYREADLRLCFRICKTLVFSRCGSNYTLLFIIGYTGRNCETQIDECLGITCPGGGDCFSDIGRYYCRCPLKKTGANCLRGM